MSRTWQLLLEAVFVENLALTFFLGMCTFLAVSRKLQTAIGLGIAVVFVQAVTVPVNSLIHRYVLLEGAWAWIGLPDLDLQFLDLIAYIGVIAAMVQILEMFLERYAPALHRTLGIYLPLVTVNCAILGGSLFATRKHLDLGDSIVYGFGSGLGWAMALVALAGIRERLKYSDPPAALRGLGITFIVVGLMALGFLAYSGLHVG